MANEETLRNERYLSLETFRKNGTGVKTPVWFAFDGDRIVIFTDGTSHKVKRIGRNPACRVAACNYSGSEVHGPWLPGKARIVATGSAEERAAYRALRDKYGWQMKMTDAASFLAGRMKRRKIIEVQLERAVAAE